MFFHFLSISTLCQRTLHDNVHAMSFDSDKKGANENNLKTPRDTCDRLRAFSNTKTCEFFVTCFLTRDREYFSDLSSKMEVDR